MELKMPAFAAGADEALLVRWLRPEGAVVAKGDELAEVETDKAAVAIESPVAGTLSRILVQSGSVRVDTPIAVIATGDGSAGSDSAPEKPNKPPAVRLVTATAAPAMGKIAVSPLARRLADQLGVDLAAVVGSGPGGRIVRADILRTGRDERRTPSDLAGRPAGEVAKSYSVRDRYRGRILVEAPLDNMRRVIARRLSESKRTIPHYYLRRDIPVDSLLKLRAELNATRAGGVKISVNDLIVKASGLALQDVPECNVVWAEDATLRLARSDIAIAVAVERGLFTPVVLDVDLKSVARLAQETSALAERARSRKLTNEECEGGAMTVTNLGMFGIDNFDAIINPPQCMILALGAGRKRGDAPSEPSWMTATLSLDHRAIDGAVGARFLAALSAHIERPLSLLA